ncbi:MAG TPA: hypothetical protein ENK78_02960, partial [Thiothrix sp.]|nr:hypothetical protein [Thiothrix sp.]
MKYKYLTILIVWLFINLPTLAFASNITGTIYQDENNNNVYDNATDIGLGNVTVSLYQNNGTPSDLSDDIFLQNTITDIATGLYQFTDIDSPLSYRIEVSETDEDLPLGVTIGTSNPLTHVTVAAGSTTANQDFGFDQQAPFNCDKHFYVGHAAAADLNSQLSRIDGQQSPFALASVVANQT